jgi:hypothetical protein
VVCTRWWSRPLPLSTRNMEKGISWFFSFRLSESINRNLPVIENRMLFKGKHFRSLIPTAAGIRKFALSDPR